jgi:alanyl-tRNA synthetase
MQGTLMNSFDIRKKFLDFFEQHNHTVVPSSSLIPAEDPTLLFTNAGMNQFKDLFLGKEKRSYVRATSSQKCVRAGGKHNDLDAVGFTERHLTFFEMLGNFSFGDYFKKEAIEFAWDLLTKHLHLPPEKLFVTVFTTDDEAYEIWNKVVGIPPERIFRLGEKDNFWAMGETGPCGPCSEIYYDRGPEKQGPFEHASPGSDSPRYIEIWNLVFMQYNRQTDGALQPLTQTGVDTGMGLERLCMVLQGKDNVYHTDLFTTLIKALEELTGISYAAGDDNLKAAFHVLGDHVRSSSLLIADGCSPANDGRGYVLRKIIRRAALFAQKLSDDQQLLAKLAEHFITHMGIIFPELVTNKSLIINLLNSEIERFSANLVQGQNILAKFVEEQTKAGSTIIPGEHMFKLYDTYGFPPELTQLMAQERGFSIDWPAFETEMKKQQELSGKKNKEAVQDIFVTENVSTKFVGYETLETTSRILFSSIIDNEAWIITEESPFYVECGGQVNDHGWVTINGHTFDVVDLKKTGDHKHPAIAIKLALPVGPTPEINVGDSAHSKVNEQTRMETVRNHTATHMLQAALIEVLGKQVKQAGSLVCASYLRFDFTHHEAMTKDQIEAVENLVNQKIQEAIPTNIFNTTLQDAKTQSVISFFGEKYNPENVRVVQIPGFSAELCGGTHAHNTGIIGAFKITSDTALSTGVRRLFAVTGPEALKLFQQSFSSTKKLSEEFKVKQDAVVSAVAKLQENYSHALTQIKQLKKQLIKSQLPDWKLEMKNIGSVPFLYRELDDVQGDELKGIATELEKIAPGFYCLVTKLDNRFGFFAYVAKQYEAQIDLKKFAEFLKVTWNLKGGGSSKQIQGGGQQLPEQFAEKVAQWLSALV